MGHCYEKDRELRLNFSSGIFLRRFSFWLGVGSVSLTNPKNVQASENFELAPITIIATGSDRSTLDTAGSDTAVTAEDLLRSGAQSLGDALKHVPGVSVPFDATGADALVPYLGSGEKAINIRGVEGNRVSLTLDGVRQPQEFFTAGGTAGPGRIYFDPAVLSQVELLKSASSGLYGSDAMGGAVRVRTVSPVDLLGETLKGSGLSNTTTYASVNESLSNRLTLAQGNGVLAHSAAYSFRDVAERKNNSNLPSDPQDLLSHAVVYKALRRTESWEITGTMDLFDQEVFTDVDSIETGNNRKVTHQSERTRNRFSLQGELFPQQGMGFAENLSAQINHQRAEQNSLNFQDRSDNDVLRRRDISFRTDLIGLEILADKEFDHTSFRQSFRYGLETSLSQIESNYLVTDRLADGSILYDDRKSMAPSEAFQLGFFILDEITFGPEEEWTLTPILRFEHYEVSPETDQAFTANTASVSFHPVDYENTILAAPGLSLLRRLTPSTNLYFSYNRGIRNPSPEELNGFFEHPPTDSTTSAFIIDANPNLEEETSDSFEIGLQASTKHHALQFAAYKNFHQGFISMRKQPSLGVVDLYSNENIGEVEIQGAELSWRWTSRADPIPDGAWTGGISSHLSKGNRINPNHPLDTIEPFKTSAHLGYQTAENIWGSRLSATYRAKKRLEDIDPTQGSLPIGDSLVLDLVAWRKLSDHWKGRLGINNLTDEKYFIWSAARRGGGHSGSSTEERNTQPGTNFFLSLTANF